MAAAVLLLATATACSGDAGDAGGSTDGGRAGAVHASAGVTTTVDFGRVTGSLSPAGKRRVKQQVAAVVDRWVDAAYGGSYPRRTFADAFPGFSPRAARLARADRATLSNAGVGGRLDGVRFVNRRVEVDVLSVRGRPAGVTARVTLGMRLTGEVRRQDRVTGTLYLTPSGKSWRIFAYDLSRRTV